MTVAETILKEVFEISVVNFGQEFTNQNITNKGDYNHVSGFVCASCDSQSVEDSFSWADDSKEWIFADYSFLKFRDNGTIEVGI